MFIMYLLEIVAVIIFGLIVISQIIVPSFEGRKLFPMFTKLSTMEAVEVELKQTACEAAMQRKIEPMFVKPEQPTNVMKDVK